ncbi:hypothetical protein ACRJ4B_15220 [Streptomyces sp. GTA36]
MVRYPYGIRLRDASGGLRVLLAHRGSAQVEEPLAGAQRLWWS